MKTDDKAYLTMFVDKNITEEKAQQNPEKTAIDQLAKVVSYLEDRIAKIEEIMLGKSKKRGIKIVEK